MMNSLHKYRQEIDEFMRYHSYAPLNPEQRRKFKGLNYYSPADELLFEVDVILYGDDEPLVQMQTSTGDARPYRRWGKFLFEVNGEPAALVLYADPHGDDLFLPFKDATNGKETYGAGRYLDNHRPALTLLSSGKLRVDFNYSYNPYCAYSPAYSCPLPPPENWLKVPIRAGEKDFK